MNKLCCVLAAVLMLWMIPSGTVCAEEATSPAEAAVSEDAGMSKAGKIVGFLAIFTVVCGGTAYIVMRPSLKKLKEAKNASAPAEKQNIEK